MRPGFVSFLSDGFPLGLSCGRKRGVPGYFVASNKKSKAELHTSSYPTLAKNKHRGRGWRVTRSGLSCPERPSLSTEHSSVVPRERLRVNKTFILELRRLWES